MSVALLGAPQPWPPPLPPTLPSYDCSISVCTIFCPQHCNILTPPITDSSSPSSRLSPLMVALITLLVSAFLLLCYYTVISKYCKRRREDIRRRRDRDRIERLELESRLDQLIYDSTTNTTTNRNTNPVPNSSNGLDERMIKAITVFKYRRGEGIIEGTDCAVCLSEFRDSESLRLMPNCQHAFHVDCIDTWLKSQSNCPICRSGMIYQVPPARAAAAATEVRTAAMRVEGREGVVVVVVSGGEQRCEIEIGEVNCGGGER